MKGHQEKIVKGVIVVGAIMMASLILVTYIVLPFFEERNQQFSYVSPKPVGEIYFYKPTSAVGVFAIGMVIQNNHSIVFLWNKTANITVIEVDYLCPPEFEKAFNFITRYGRSPYTGGKIVPSNITRISENVLEFKYYDGWCLHWSFGYARLYLSNKTLQYVSHAK
ncbi:MAG: hypothetical protein J7L63_04170 [Thermoplasmata archaeon]|nr:hypothetical protein [Thermoplasmata archaeon]